MDEVITDQGLAVTCETDANRFLRVVRQLYTSRPQMFNEKLDYDVYSNGKVQNTPIIGWITKKLGFDEGLFLLPDLVVKEVLKNLPTGQQFNEGTIGTALDNAGYLICPTAGRRGIKVQRTSPLTKIKVSGWLLKLVVLNPEEEETTFSMVDDRHNHQVETVQAA